MGSKKRASFSGKLGYVLATAGASVGLGNIWRFPYLAAKYGGGIFILIYFLLAITFGYTMIISETALGRISRKSPVGAFRRFTDHKGLRFGGWLNAIVPGIIVPYYCVIGGWVLRYLFEFLRGDIERLEEAEYFSTFLGDAGISELFFVLFAALTVVIVALGVNSGVERISKFMMPVLLCLAVLIAIFSITREGAFEGVKYVLIPDFSKFSLMTIVAAMGQMFYSLSIAMGILYTFGSYMKTSIDIEKSTYQVTIVDSLVAVLSVLMIIPSIFAYSHGDPSETLNAGPSLLFISLPKVFAHMRGGRIVGIAFFLMVSFAALTSSIALLESSVSTVEDEFHMGRKKASVVMGIVVLILGSLSSLGYNVFAFVKPFGMQFLDFFDFASNSVMMPIAALATCLLITRYVKLPVVAEEVKKSSNFVGEKIYTFTSKYLAPILLVIIFVSSILNALGVISM